MTDEWSGLADMLANLIEKYASDCKRQIVRTSTVKDKYVTIDYISIMSIKS